MTMVKHEGFEINRTKKALEMLLIDRGNEFRELANVIKISTTTLGWEEFILNFCLDVNEAFKIWSSTGNVIDMQTVNKTMVLLRQLSRGKSSMIEVTHLQNIAYTLAEEFKVIYKRIE